MHRVFIISLLAGLVGLFLAGSKNRNVWGWFVISFLLPFSLLVLLFLPSLPPASSKPVRCPDCGKVMESGRDACPNCKREMPISMVECPSCGVIVREEGKCENCGGTL